LNLKKFIEKNKLLLLPDPKASGATSPAKLVEQLAAVERTNHSRLMHRREDVLQEVVVPILEGLQVYQAFKKLAKHR
jgi:hypothetical protein